MVEGSGSRARHGFIPAEAASTNLQVFFQRIQRLGVERVADQVQQKIIRARHGAAKDDDIRRQQIGNVSDSRPQQPRRALHYVQREAVALLCRAKLTPSKYFNVSKTLADLSLCCARKRTISR